MAKLDEDGTNGRRFLWTMICILGIIMTGGAITGFVAEHRADGGGPFSATALGIISVFVLVIATLAYVIWRNLQSLKTSGEQLTRRERLNNRMVAAFAVAGGLMGVVLAVSGDLGSQNPDIFSSGPIAPGIAIALALVIGIIMPFGSWYWHMRVIDEQESQAYRSGALLAVYAFWIGAPVWWLLWRGGLAPQPDGIALYLMTIFIALIVWFYEKYR